MRRLLSLGLIVVAACNSSTDENQSDNPAILDLQSSQFGSCALVDGGALWCWGAVYGAGGLASPSLTPVKVDVPGHVTSFAMSSYSLCAANDAGATYCRGSWIDVDLGIPYGTGSEMYLLQDSLVLHGLSSSDNHSCGVTADNRIVCWGATIWGARGEGAPDTLAGGNLILNEVAGGNSFTSVASGAAHSCGLRTDATVACWGLTDRLGVTPPAGQVGQTCYYSGLECTWMPALLDLSGIQQLSASAGYTCVRAGSIRCWGPVDAVPDDDPFDPQDQPTLIDLPEAVIGLSVGGQGACVLGTSGGAYCWGYPGAQLGHHGTDGLPAAVETELRFRQIAAAIGHTCAVSGENSVYCWGSSDFGRLGRSDSMTTYTPRKVTATWR